MKFFTPLWAILLTYYPDSFQIYGNISKIYDGDTIELKRDGGGYEKIRLVYIDAAELEQKPWGARAKQQLDHFLNKRVRVEVVGRGYYGRILGEVFFENRSLNLELVKSAIVWIYPWSHFQTLKQKDHYLEAQSHNKRLKKGIWSMKVMAPWKYRKKRRKRRRGV